MHCSVADIEQMPLSEWFGWLAKTSIDAERRRKAEKADNNTTGGR